MNPGSYLPSGRFVVVLFSLIFSLIVIGAAEYYVNPQELKKSLRISQPANTLYAVAPQTAADWQSAFASSTAFMDNHAVADQAQSLIDATRSDNLTQTIGRSILINGTAAGKQGFGEDTPTQEKIISAALAEVDTANKKPNPFTAGDITELPNSTSTLQLYGSTLATAFAAHPKASYNNTMAMTGLAIDTNNEKALQALLTIEKEYRALAKQIVILPVPSLLAEDALRLANNFSRMADACASMEHVLSDPVRGLSGIEQYSNLTNQNIAVLTDIANTLTANSILFNVGDPGTIWTSFRQAQLNQKNPQPTAVH